MSPEWRCQVVVLPILPCRHGRVVRKVISRVKIGRPVIRKSNGRGSRRAVKL